MDGRLLFLRKKFLDNLAHNWTVPEMANEVGLSAPHLQKLFKRNLGISPHAYLHELRLDRCREMLETTFLRLKEIGQQIGISDCSHLSQHFRHKYGWTPTEYRRQFWNKAELDEYTRPE